MNPFEFVIAIIAITTIGSIIKAKYGVDDGKGRRLRMRHGIGMGMFDGRQRDDEDYDAADSRETVRLKEEVRMLKDRIQTLERIAVDKESSLAREIDDLRDR